MSYFNSTLFIQKPNRSTIFTYMNITSYSLLGSISSNPTQTNKFTTTVDPFYIGTGIGLVGGMLTAIVILNYLYTKKRNKLNNKQIMFEKHTNINNDIIATPSIDLSV